VICHVPPGSPRAKHTIIIGEPAREAHIRGGSRGHNTDYDGECLAEEGQLAPPACEYL
jgi:hypothetical protein